MIALPCNVSHEKSIFFVEQRRAKLAGFFLGKESQAEMWSGSLTVPGEVSLMAALSSIQYDVFLSHSGVDKPGVEELARRLKKAGIEPFLDKWNLIPGQPWQEALEEALGQSAASR